MNRISFIIPNPVQIDLPRNTILFISNNQFVKKEAVIGQLAENVKQIRTETKQVISDNSGEIFMPGIKSEYELSTRNKLLWILSGKVYQAPMNSFLNFHYDSKINKNSFIFRSKVINQQSGLVYQLSEDFNEDVVQQTKNDDFQLPQDLADCFTDLRDFVEKMGDEESKSLNLEEAHLAKKLNNIRGKNL